MDSSNTSKTGSTAAKFWLILANLGFMAAGLVLIVYAVKLNNSAWLDVFDEQFPFIRRALFGGMIGLGCVVLIIAFIGCAGASFEKRGLLCCYNIFVVLGFMLFFVVMAGAFGSMYIANDWAGKAYPAAEPEPYVADNFNQVYCYAEAAYMCTAAPINEIIALIGIPASATSFLSGAEGVNSLCEGGQGFIGALDNFITDDTVLAAIKTACDECEEVKKYEQYEDVYEWVDSQCPIIEAGNDVIQWCGDFLFQGKKGDEYDGAPYSACRPEFLGLWSDTSKKLGIALVCFLVLLVIIMVSTCLVRRRNRTATVQQESETSPYSKKTLKASNVTQKPDEEQAGVSNGVHGQDIDARVY